MNAVGFVIKFDQKHATKIDFSIGKPNILKENSIKMLGFCC